MTNPRPELPGKPIDSTTNPAPGRSIRTQLSLLVGAVVLPFALFAGAHLLLSVDQLVSEAKADNRLLAELVASSLSQDIRDKLTLAEGLARRPELQRLETLECNRLMADFMQLQAGLIGSGYTDASGILRCASTATDHPPPPASFADVEWFQRLKSEKKPLVSKPYLGKLVSTWLVVLAAPVLDADGNLTGTVSLPLDLKSIRLIRERQMPDHKFITVVDREGTIVTRSSELEEWLGRNIKGTALVDLALQERNGAGRALGATAIDTIIGFADVPEAGWQVIVGARAEQVLAPVMRETRNTGITLLVLTLAVLLVTLALARRISGSLISLTETTRRVAAGKTHERATGAGSREVVALANDFNRMLDERALAEAALQTSEQRFRDVAGVSADWIWEVDAAGCYTYASESVRRLLGYAPDEIIGKTPFDFMPPAEAARVRDAFVTIAMRGEAFHDLENVVLDTAGRPHDTLTSGTPIRSAKGQLIGYRGVDRDITDRKGVERALQRSEEFARTTIDAVPEHVCVLDPSGRIISVNRAWRDFFDANAAGKGGRANDCIGINYFDVCQLTCRLGAEQATRIEAGIQEIMKGELDHFSLEYPCHSGAESRMFMAHVSRFHGDSGNILIRHENITERKKTERELERLAQTDALTGLANRRHFMLLAELELSRTVRYGGELSVLMLDIDHFKNVNDTYGHQTGDLVLQKLGSICREVFRGIDIVGRLGGEEFAIVLPQTGTLQATDAAERLRRTIEPCALPLPQGQPLHFTVSIGVATLGSASTNLDTLLGLADTALYEAKHGGRNRVCIFDRA